MKRVLTVVLTVVLTLGLAVSAFAGELVLEGKEAGMTISTTNGSIDQPDFSNMAIGSFYVKVGTVTFQDGSFKFWVKDLQFTVDRPDSNDTDDDGGEWTLKNDYGTFYAETGGEGLNFTLSNDKGKWLPYLGYLKPAASLDKKAKFLLTVGGEVAGVKVNANAYKSEKDNVDMNLSAAYTMDNITIDGFIGDFNGTDYYGGGVQIANVFEGATLGAGVYANTGDGLAYVVGASGIKAGNATVDVKYKFGNENVKKLTSGEWKDSAVPDANTKEFYTKAVVPVEFFAYNMELTGEFTRYLNNDTNKFKITDKFALSDTVKDVVLTAEFGSATTETYAAEATIVPGVEGLELYPRVENKKGEDLKFIGAAKYAVAGTNLLGGVEYQNDVNMYFVYGDSKATYGALNTTLAGIYLNKGGDVYKRAYVSATTDVTEKLTGVGAKFLYRQDKTDSAKVAAAVLGNYAISSDTNLFASYIFRDWTDNHFFVELKKTVGSATFSLSYGDNDDYKDEDDVSAIHELTHKKFLSKSSLPWKSFTGDDSAEQNKIKASVVVKF